MATENFPTFRKIGQRLQSSRWRSSPRDKRGQRFPTFASWMATLTGRRHVTLAQRRGLLRLIQVAAEERLSLAPLIAAWAQDEPVPQRKRLTRLSQSLADGVAIADAVERFPSLLTDEEILLVRFASESGTLPLSIRQYLEVATDDAAPIRENLRRARNYLLMMLLIGVPIALWVVAVVNPSLEAINDDFGFSNETFDAVQDIQPVLFDWLLPLSAFVLTILVISHWYKTPGRNFRRNIAPMLFGSVRSLRVAQLQRRLGETCAAGKPLAGAVSTLARYHYDPTLRHKLLFARNELSLGAELWPSFRAVGLVSPEEQKALDAGDRVGVTAWTLAALAGVRQRRAIRRQTWLSLALVLTVVLLFGVFVLMQAVSMISFLSEIIRLMA